MPQPRNTIRSLDTFLCPAALTGTSQTPPRLFFLPSHPHPLPQLYLKELIQIFLQVLDEVGVRDLGKNQVLDLL